MIIIDNSPASYIFNNENAIPTVSWYNDMSCKELYQFVPLLKQLSKVNDVREYIPQFVKNNKIDYKKANKLLGLDRPKEPEKEEKKVKRVKIAETQAPKVKQKLMQEEEKTRDISPQRVI